MSFNDSCSCHVFAIDGWENDARGKLVNDAYSGQQQFPKPNVGIPAIITHVVNAVRQQTNAVMAEGRETCTLHVLYYDRGLPGAPDHWWLEYSRRIYETNANKDLWITSRLGDPPHFPDPARLPKQNVIAQHIGKQPGIPLTQNQFQFLKKVSKLPLNQVHVINW